MTRESWVVPGGAPNNVIHSTFDVRSNLLSMKDQFSSLHYAYDARDRMTSIDNRGTPTAPEVTLHYRYDAVGNVVEVSDTIGGQPGGTNTYAYDALNRPTTFTQHGAGIREKRVDVVYNALGQYQSLQRFADLAGSQPVIRSSYTYDEQNRLSRLSHRNSTTEQAFYQLSYDAAGRITRIADVDGTQTLSYDDAHLLTGVENASPGTVPESLSYDLNGNRIATGVQTGAGNRLLSDGTFSYQYDDEGNLILRTELATGRKRLFTWDYRNRLVRVTDQDASGTSTQVVQYVYDALDRRIAKLVDGTPSNAGDEARTHFVYDREDILWEFLDDDGSGPHVAVPSMRYLHGRAIDEVFAQENFLAVDTGLRVLWLLPDHLGSIRDLVDNAGDVRNHIIYRAFGQIVSQSNSQASTRFLFTEREFDIETGLYYYRARYYDPHSGRFLSEDPIRFEALDTNIYRYVGNDPVGSADPTRKGGVSLFALVYLVLAAAQNYCEDIYEAKVDALSDNSSSLYGREYTWQELDGLWGEAGCYISGDVSGDHKIFAGLEWLSLAAAGLLVGGRIWHQRRKRKLDANADVTLDQ